MQVWKMADLSMSHVSPEALDMLNNRPYELTHQLNYSNWLDTGFIIEMYHPHLEGLTIPDCLLAIIKWGQANGFSHVMLHVDAETCDDLDEFDHE